MVLANMMMLNITRHQGRRSWGARGPAPIFC